MLHIDRLQLGYGQAPVLHDLSLQVPEGQFASLVGPSGCGKSSVLRAVVGLHEPDDGAIELDVDGRDVGFLFQDDALLPWRSVRHNVALPLLIRGEAKRSAYEQAELWLERMGLVGFGDRFPQQLSGGQRKRVALAQTLAPRPRLLLMDEPFASLDAIVRRRVTDDLLAWVERDDITVVLVTHDLEEALTLSDRVHLMSAGPYADIVASYEVPLPRPRDLVATRTDPRFGRLFEQLWSGLAEVVDGGTDAAADTAREQESAA
ncbi:MAG: ABC transporter ATP-binding protein [Actinobacteria bacterium]|jgi:NitT/TauT family transport system ATP-binding protein|nr:ABC transporter ATP-binding protein [Actinomycetota bacterium]